jgi:hypothetical protein
VCLYLSLYISFLLIWHFFLFHLLLMTVWELLTLGKRNNMNKRYINVLLYGIYLSLCVSGGTIDRKICLLCVIIVWDLSCISTRPNKLSLVCLCLSLYISFLLFGHFLLFFATKKRWVPSTCDESRTRLDEFQVSLLHK